MRVLTVGNMYPHHHHGGYELVWHSAVEHLRARGHELRVLTTGTQTGASEPDPPSVHRDLRWHFRDAQFEPLRLRARIAMARHNHRVLERQLADFRPDVVGWWAMGRLSLTLLESVRRAGMPGRGFRARRLARLRPLGGPLAVAVPRPPVAGRAARRASCGNSRSRRLRLRRHLGLRERADQAPRPRSGAAPALHGGSALGHPPLRRLAEDPDLRLKLRDGGLETAPRFTEAGLNARVELALAASLSGECTIRRP